MALMTMGPPHTPPLNLDHPRADFSGCSTVSPAGSLSSTSDMVTTSTLSPSLPYPVAPAMNRRPKLTLQTASLSMTFGKSTTALLAATSLSTASPTTRNTYANTYDVTGPTPTTAKPSRLSFALVSPAPTHMNREYPSYHQPLGIKSILRNSPSTHDHYRRGDSYSSLSAGAVRRRFFPAPKKVAFKPTIEEIKTTIYIARSSDLVDDAEDSFLSFPLRDEIARPSTPPSAPLDTDAVTSSPNKRKDHCDDGEAAATVIVAAPVEAINNTSADTPVQGRQKRRKSIDSVQDIPTIQLELVTTESTTELTSEQSA